MRFDYVMPALVGICVIVQIALLDDLPTLSNDFININAVIRYNVTCSATAAAPSPFTDHKHAIDAVKLRFFSRLSVGPKYTPVTQSHVGPTVRGSTDGYTNRPFHVCHFTFFQVLYAKHSVNKVCQLVQTSRLQIRDFLLRNATRFYGVPAMERRQN